MRQANELVERLKAAIGKVPMWDGDTFAHNHTREELYDAAQAAIDAIIPDDPTLAARLISELDTDESESPVDYRPGDYKPRVEVAKYVIGRIRGEVK